MIPLLTITSLLILPLAHSANVLVIGGLRGSHLFISVEIAKKMAEFGHDVTVVTPYNEPRVDLLDGTFRFTTFKSYDETFREKENDVKRWQKIFTYALHQPSQDMMANFLGSSDEMKRICDDINSNYISFFNGTEFARLLQEKKFDLVILEDSISLAPMIRLIDHTIPTIGIYCQNELKSVRDRFGLPSIMHSEPNMFNDLTDGNSPPTFFERWHTIRRLLKYFSTALPMVLSVVGKEAARTNRPLNDYLLAVYDVAFVLDHPAFSFPFLSPPNVFYLGPFHLKGRSLDPLPETYNNFLTICPHPHTVLLSFGSYLEDITKFSGTATILKTLSMMDLCVIVKSKVDVVSKYNLPSEKFLEQTWIPQKELLESGKVDVFISHCGNNGRLESIYYYVPLLCVPLFADQYYNARLVRRNGFGGLITWEDLNEAKLRESIDQLVREKDIIVEKMKRAVEIASNDPGAGTDTLKFYSDLLIEKGEADFLINRVILKQSAMEIYNFDFALIALIAFMSITSVLILCSCKMCKCVVRKMHKSKTD